MSTSQEPEALRGWKREFCRSCEGAGLGSWGSAQQAHHCHSHVEC